MPLAIPALITAAATVGTAIYSSNAASNAQDKALSAQNNSTQQSLAAQQAALDRITALQSPFIQAGASVLPGLASRVSSGAPNFSAPSYAQPQSSAYPAPQPAAGAASHVGAVGVPDGSLGTGKLGNGVSIDPASVGPSAGGPTPVTQPGAPPSAGAPAPNAAPTSAPVAAAPDWNAYLAANPDVASTWVQDHPPQSVGDINHDGKVDAGDSAALHYQLYGQNEGRPISNLAPAPSAGATPQTSQAPPTPQNLGTASPVVADYARPDQGTSPSVSQFIDPSKFTTSPGYQFRLNEGLRNVNAGFGAKGLLQSGAALQGYNDYAQNSASSEYQNWFNQQQTQYQDAASQFNTDRNNSNQNFADDRSYGTNLAMNNRDFANNQYNTQTSNMFQLAGIGSTAANAVSGAVTNNGNQSSNLFQTAGNNAADAAYNQGSAQQHLAGTVGGAVTNLFSAPSRITGNSSASPTYAYPTTAQLSGTW